MANQIQQDPLEKNLFINHLFLLIYLYNSSINMLPIRKVQADALFRLHHTDLSLARRVLSFDSTPMRYN